MIESKPGLVVLLGSGETSASGRRVWDWLLHRLPQPIRVNILETPAGFEPNSEQVAAAIAAFVDLRLQNHQPETIVVPARKRGTPFDPDDPVVVAPLLSAGLIFMGPGSPTYAVRQLRDSLAWQLFLARQRLGTAVLLASSAVIAASRWALPVYEIYKVGDDLHWQPGLDLFGPYGLPLVFVPHWNNNDGGQELDTSRCYMGQARFGELLAMLSPGITVVGIDEHTALVVDPAQGCCRVLGRGQVTVMRNGEQRVFSSRQTFAASVLGDLRLPEPGVGIPAAVWRQAKAASREMEPEPEPPPEVLDLVAQREDARVQRQWAVADALRDAITQAGWQVEDAPDGPRLRPVATQS